MTNVYLIKHMMFELIVYILSFTFSSRGKSESIISLPVNRPWKGLFPPAVFGCCCPCSLCLTLSSKTKLTLHLLAGTDSPGTTETLLCNSPNSIWGSVESTFHCNINFLVSIRSHLSSCWKYSLLRLQTVAVGHCVAFTLSNNHIRSASMPA